jgi:hypothetical protein
MAKNMIQIPEKYQKLLKLQRGTTTLRHIEFSQAHVNKVKEYVEPGERIMDIGAGLGVQMALVGDNYFDEMHLVDRTEHNPSGRVSNYGPSSNFDFYADMEFAVDLVEQHCPNTKVFGHDPESLPDLQFDCFVSFYSWGYHYGMDNDYLQYVKTHMKPDGKCFLTVKEKNDLNFSIAITNEGLIYEKVHKFEAAHLVKITHK